MQHNDNTFSNWPWSTQHHVRIEIPGNHFGFHGENPWIRRIAAEGTGSNPPGFISFQCRSVGSVQIRIEKTLGTSVTQLPEASGTTPWTFVSGLCQR